MKETFGIVGLILIILVLIGVGPVLTLLSINALFGTDIVINVWTYLSVCWLNLTTFGGLSTAIRNSKK